MLNLVKNFASQKMFAWILNLMTLPAVGQGQRKLFLPSLEGPRDTPTHTEGVNTNRRTSGLLIMTLGWLSLIGLNASPAATPVHHKNNGVWLGHAYVTAQSYVDKIPTLAQEMKDNYGILDWFVNVGKVNSSGRLIGGADGLSKAVAFLNALNDWEASHGHKFKVIAWINGMLYTHLICSRRRMRGCES